MAVFSSVQMSPDESGTCKKGDLGLEVLKVSTRLVVRSKYILVPRQ